MALKPPKSSQALLLQRDTYLPIAQDLGMVAHADRHLVGPSAGSINCGVPINNGPMHLVAKAALRALTKWLETGTAPVIASRIEVAPGPTPKVVRNADGIALGGIRNAGTWGDKALKEAKLLGTLGADGDPLEGEQEHCRHRHARL